MARLLASYGPTYPAFLRRTFMPILPTSATWTPNVNAIYLTSRKEPKVLPLTQMDEALAISNFLGWTSNFLKKPMGFCLKWGHFSKTSIPKTEVSWSRYSKKNQDFLLKLKINIISTLDQKCFSHFFFGSFSPLSPFPSQAGKAKAEELLEKIGFGSGDHSWFWPDKFTVFHISFS